MISERLEYDKKKTVYPILKCTEDLVVLFTGSRMGMVVQSSKDFQDIGYRSETWNESGFTDYDGIIKLQNG